MVAMSNSAFPLSLTVGGRTFQWGRRTYVMGIINISPESFSGDGLTNVNAAVARALQFVQEGADILDIGGQSTRPRYSATIEAGKSGPGRAYDYDELASAEEIARVAPAIRAISGETDVPISIDTYKSEVASAALDAGASMVNDVWGLMRDPVLAEVAATRRAPLIMMHNQEGTQYTQLIPDIIAQLRRSMAIAMEAGIPRECMVIDAGFGFGKTVEHNLEVLRRLGEIRSALGLPMLLGTSRKSTIGHVLDLPVDQRMEGTAATVSLGIAQGADIIRVHDVRAMARVAQMTDAVVRGGRWNE